MCSYIFIRFVLTFFALRSRLIPAYLEVLVQNLIDLKSVISLGKGGEKGGEGRLRALRTISLFNCTVIYNRSWCDLSRLDSIPLLTVHKMLSDKGTPLTVSVDLYVEAFGNIKEANMVNKQNKSVIVVDPLSLRSDQHET